MALPVIVFKAPIAGIFTGLWKSNDRSFEKKVGVFETPGLLGSYTQDKGAKSTVYPLTVWFDGPGYEIIANGFYEALRRQPGRWTVIHPVKGILRLQLTKYTEPVDPVGYANGVEVNTEWLEPAETNPFLSALQFKVAAASMAAATILSAISLVNSLRRDRYSSVLAATSAASSSATAADETLSGTASASPETADAFATAQADLTTNGTSFLNDPSNTDAMTAFATALTDIITIPADEGTDFAGRAALYDLLMSYINELNPTGTTEDDYNTVLMIELSLIACVVAYVNVILSSTFRTRTDVVTAMTALTNTCNSVFTEIEQVQENFKNNDIDDQYIALTTAFTELSKLCTLAHQYLLNQYFNLNAERRFTLTEWRSPIEITATEYGGFGDNDENYQLFLDSNNLTGDDVLLLPPGREVVVYV